MKATVTPQAFAVFLFSFFLTACSVFSPKSDNSEVENHSLSEVILSPDLRIDLPEPAKNLIFRDDLIIFQFHEEGSSLSIQRNISSFDIGGYAGEIDAAYLLSKIYDSSFQFDDDDINKKLKASRLAFGIESGDAKIVKANKSQIFISYGKGGNNFAYIVNSNSVYLLTYVGSINDFEKILNKI